MEFVQYYDVSGKRVGNLKLNDDIFNVPFNKDLIYETMKMYQANRRQGNASTKTRDQVQGSGRKLWKQKGTGRARMGSIRSPLWTKGGVVFGPHPRDYSYTMPKKARQKALRVALSFMAAEGRIKVIDSFAAEKPKTKLMSEMFGNMEISGKKTLLLYSEDEENFIRSARNLSRLSILFFKLINSYDVLKNDCILMTRNTFKKLEEVFS